MRAEGLALAIELSQREGSVALGGEGLEPVAVRFPAAGAQAEDPLFPAIDRLLREAGRAPRELRLIAISIGPGGFTGLRVAVTAARMLAEALGAAIVAVPSALIAAAGSSREGPWFVALAAKRETFWGSLVERSGESLAIRGEPGIVAASDAHFADARVLLADEHAPAVLAERARASGLFVEPPTFDALHCLRLGRLLAAGGRFVDPLQLLPIYPREPEAVTLWRERHG